jgi:capsular polysaccharide transport system permease protein
MSSADSSPPQKPHAGLTRSWATPRAITALILREMSTRYGRSPGGFAWAILEPLGGVIILGLCMSLVVRSPSLGTNFFLFYATGFLPFTLYQNLALFVGRCIAFSKPLLKYPAVTWVDAMLARLILNSLTSILVIYLILGSILALADTNTVLDLPPILIAIGLSALLGWGVGALNCALIGLIDAWDLVWSIFTRPLFLVSGVIFLYEDLPTNVQSIMWYNPLMHIVGYMRMGFYPMYSPDYLSPTYTIGFGLVCLALGIILLGRYHRDILNK